MDMIWLGAGTAFFAVSYGLVLLLSRLKAED